MSQQAPVKKKKSKREVLHANFHVQATFNNTLVVVTDPAGDKLCQASAGSEGFKGSRKSTPLAGQQAGATSAKIAKEKYGVKAGNIYVKGPGPGRESAIKGIVSAGIVVNGKDIADVTGIPHNGCRPPKKRRV